jgi:biotin carboxylase
MIAKIIVHGRTRGDAIKIMQRALKEFRIDGVKTTVSLHKKISRIPTSARATSTPSSSRIVWKPMKPSRKTPKT